MLIYLYVNLNTKDVCIPKVRVIRGPNSVNGSTQATWILARLIFNHGYGVAVLCIYCYTYTDWRSWMIKTYQNR